LGGFESYFFITGLDFGKELMFVVILIKPTGLYGVAGKAFGFAE